MLFTLNKIKTNLHRYFRAKRLGISFYSVSTFTIPKEFQVCNRRIALDYPLEEGIFHDFISIFLDDDYGLELLQTKNIQSILDIGGNVGFFSLAAYNKFKHAKFHIYEPNLELSDFINKNLNFRNVEHFREAVGLHPGVVALQSLGDSNQSRVIKSKAGSLPMISISEAINKFGDKLDLLKLDCEGSEWEILEDRNCLNPVQNITMEYHLWKNNKTHDYAINLVKENGFRILRHAPSTDFGLIVGTRDSSN